MIRKSGVLRVKIQEQTMSWRDRTPKSNTTFTNIWIPRELAKGCNRHTLEATSENPETRQTGNSTKKQIDSSNRRIYAKAREKYHQCGQIFKSACKKTFLNDYKSVTVTKSSVKVELTPVLKFVRLYSNMEFCKLVRQYTSLYATV